MIFFLRNYQGNGDIPHFIRKIVLYDVCQRENSGFEESHNLQNTQNDVHKVKYHSIPKTKNLYNITRGNLMLPKSIGQGRYGTTLG